MTGQKTLVRFSRGDDPVCGGRHKEKFEANREKPLVKTQVDWMDGPLPVMTSACNIRLLGVLF